MSAIQRRIRQLWLLVAQACTIAILEIRVRLPANRKRAARVRALRSRAQLIRGQEAQ
jgi:hypothetical protein